MGVVQLGELALDGVPQEELDRFLEWREKVRGLNINEVTLLATDYANHFNEIVMLLDMIPDMPDMIEDCAEWAPKSYQDHFKDNEFPDWEIVNAAYDAVPTKYRTRFEQTVRQIDLAVLTGIHEIKKAIEVGDEALIQGKAKNVHSALETLMVVLNGLIHGNGTTMDQDEIDHMIAGF